jgi:phosphatidylglycerophosphate synthase/uncharacterized membrane protein YbhN (UPF0104 family)
MRGRASVMTLAVSPASSSRAPGDSPRGPSGLAWSSALLSMALVGVAVTTTGIQQVVARLKGVDLRWLGVAFAVGCVQVALLGLRWSRVARALDIDLSWPRATGEYALSVLGNQLMPSGFAGDGLRGVRLARSSNVGAWLSFEALAVDRASGQLALWLLVALGAPFSVRAGIVTGGTLVGLTVAFGVASGLTWWLAFRQPPTEDAGRLRSSLRRAAGVLFSSRAAVHLPLSFLLVGCNTLQLYVAARAIGIMLPWAELFWLSPLLLVAASMPSFVGGWGIREGASALLFASAGFPSSAGVAVSLVFGAFALVCALPAIVVLSLDNPRALGEEGAPTRERWGDAHGLLMLGGTAVAVASGLPMLPTCIGLLSLIVLIVASRGGWTPTRGFGLANSVTTLRLFLTLALVIQPELRAGLFLAFTALTILGLDLVDGWLARRSGGAGQFGARYDMEVDAVFVLSLSCALWARDVAGIWVLLAGLWRYLFVVIPLLVPSRGGEAPRSILYRSAYAVMVTCFLLALVAPATLARPLAFLGTFVLSASFLRSFWYRYSPPSTA